MPAARAMPLQAPRGHLHDLLLERKEKGVLYDENVTWCPSRPFTVMSWVTVTLTVCPFTVTGTLKE